PTMDNLGLARTTASSPRAPAEVIYGFSIRKNDVPTLVQWSFLVFIVGFPFEALGTQLGFGSLSLARIAGVLFFASFFFYYKPAIGIRRLPPVPKSMWCFLGYMAVYSMSALFLVDPEDFAAAKKDLFKLIELILLFWTASHLLQDPKFAKKVLLVYAIATVILAIGSVLHLPG